MKNDPKTPSANNYDHPPEGVFELINKYGTYEVQPTCEKEGEYPKIAQGLSLKEKHRRNKNKNRG